ncbi:uncharacterized protein TNCV_1879321 [Trichonephila clavipes]|nr:uncharacterized protein TNCV_1879321 [Trichonephila clavipes]
MYFTRSGKIKISTSDPVCAVQITAIDQILNTPVKANIIWEGFTLRFLLFDIPTNVHLADVAIELKNSNDLDIVEIRRFVKPNSCQEASPVLITILGINTPECIKLWFFNHRIQLFIDKPRQCSKCFSYTHLSRFCSSPIRCINCGESHTEQCINFSNCINCKGDHPTNSPNCPNFIKEKKILEFKCNHHLTLGEARHKFKETHSANYSTVLKTAAPVPNMQEFEKKKKLENIVANFQTALEKQTTAIMNSVQTMLESMFKHLVNIIEISKQPSSRNRKKKANLLQQKFDIAVPSLSPDKDNSYNNIDIG